MNSHNPKSLSFLRRLYNKLKEKANETWWEEKVLKIVVIK